MASSSQHRGVSQSSPSGSQHRTLSQSSPSGSQHRTMSQSSPSGSQQPSVSQPSHSTGDNTSQSKKTKLPVIVQADGRVTGVYGGKWSSRVGHWIRAIVPISYASWDTVDDTFKDEVWGKLMEQVTSVEEEMAEESSERGGDADYDITRDPLARVFGKDKGRRTRGYSSCMSNKQVQKFAIAEGILENMRHNGSTNGQPCMHTTEVDSTSVRRTQQVPNLNPPSRLSSNPNVKILGRKGEHVANGYVKSDNKKCHFRDIVGDEKVVYVTNVLVGDAPVYDGPQDDIAYLRDIATGGFLIWAGGRLQYED
ncbi:hypothetical protein IFM89_038898 [Coptis chinensis]|uniref:Uncharacterized protein n=1 Tax=Coptis chinensis TaxID=261450 RepID=A0A835MGX0_9MAGN|nr:hypothetical protein IFM89_038898 [Coptis chinensis]